MSLEIDSILFDVLTSDPASPVEGQFWYNTTEKSFKSYQSGAVSVAAPKNNFVATTNPSVSDDSTQGYSVGSRWINLSTDDEYVCTHATVGAAVWHHFAEFGNHAASHKNGGSDEVATATAAANAIPKAGAGGTFAAGWIDDTAHGTRGGGTQHSVATTSVPGFMSDTDKLKLDNIAANGSGDDWVSGLLIEAQPSPDQTVKYGSGTYLVNGVLYTVTPASNYSLISGFGGVNHYTALAAGERALVAIYVDTAQVIKSTAGAPTSGAVTPLPAYIVDTVRLAYVVIRKHSNGSNKNITPADITDIRTGTLQGDEAVKISTTDTTSGFLRDKLTDNGNIAFTKENADANETLKADVKALGITDAHIAAANKDGASGTASMRTLGTGSAQACAGNDSRLSDGRTDSNAIHGNAANEISALTEKTTPVGADLIIIEDSAASGVKKKVQITNLPGGSGGGSADWKDSCRVATTANITLSGTQTIDGVSVVAGNRVLVKSQTTGANNGIYVCASGSWSRATDADVSSEVTSGMACYISEGTANAGTVWYLSTVDTITLGTTALTFTNPASGGSAAGGKGAVQFRGNSAGVFDSDTRFTWDANGHYPVFGLAPTGGLPSLLGTANDNNNTYMQWVQQNFNAGIQASCDLVINNDLGTDSVHYGDLGLNSSSYSDGAYPLSLANDLYLYNQDGRLTIGTASSYGATHDVILHSGGFELSNERLRLVDSLTAKDAYAKLSTHLRLLNDTTANRPTTPLAGMVRYNTTSNRFEGYENGAWTRMSRADLDWKDSCRVATTANITLSGTQTIDGVAVVAGDRVLVKDQTTGANNGIYECAAGAWARTIDADVTYKVSSGLCLFVSEGTTNGQKTFLLATLDPITLGTTALVFGLLSATPSGSAGGDLAGTYPNPTVAALAITDAKVAAANKDGTAGTASMRTLGTGATQACAGNDSRLSDSRAPNGSAGGDLAGTYPSPTVAQASGAFALTAVISPTSIGADQNDYNPTSLSTASRLRLTSSGNYNITGMAGGALGRILTVFNIGSNNLTLTNEDAASSAANRFSLPGSASLVIIPNEAVLLQYDNTSSRWRLVSANDPYGTAANTACQGNDSRLSDDRAASGIRTATTLVSVSGATAPTNGQVLMATGSTAATWQTPGANSLVYSEANAAGDITTTSTTDVQATSMTLTPGAGTYYVTFSTDWSNGTNSTSMYANLYANGSLVTNSERQYAKGTSAMRCDLALGALVTVAAAQAIEVKWRVSAGTGTMGNRSLFLLKVA